MSHWHLVARARELANEGDYVCLPWRADGEVAVMRQAGELVAFNNLCPHRGARIFDSLRGNREPRCAYHGRLASAANVKHYETGMIGDWLLVSDAPPHAPHCAPETIFQFLTDAPPLTLHSMLSYVIDAHWTVCVENALDFEHVEHVHAGSLAKLALVPKDLQCFKGGSSIEEFASEAQRLGHLSKFFPHEQPFDYMHAHLFPYACLSSTRGWTYSLQHYFPRADGRTNFIHRLYTAPTTRPMPEFFDSVAKLNAQVFAEDAAICARVPAGHAGLLTARERRIAHFRSCL
jgi:nitrite reductase/ring-hydroxylating ferredoxin subunit